MKDTIKTIGGLISISALILTGRGLYLKGKMDAVKELQEKDIENKKDTDDIE